MLTSNFFSRMNDRMKNMQTVYGKPVQVSWNLTGWKYEMPPYVQHKIMQSSHCDSEPDLYVDRIGLVPSYSVYVCGLKGGLAPACKIRVPIKYTRWLKSFLLPLSEV